MTQAISVIGANNFASPPAVIKRFITIKIILQTGSYSNSPAGSNIKTFTCNSEYANCNAICNIQKRGLGFSGESANITIYGLNMDSIKDLTYLQTLSPLNLGQNYIEVYAGNEETDKDLPNFIYRGQIYEAKLSTNPASDNIAFTISSLSGGNSLNQYTQSTSIKGNATHQTIIRNIVSKAEYGYTILFNLVNGYAKDIYLKGNWRDQLAVFCHKFRYKFRIDGANIYVAPANKLLYKGKETTISAKNVMQGTPTGADRSIVVNTWYDSNLVYGQKIVLEANQFSGKYIIIGMGINIANNDDAWDNKLTLMRYYGTE